MHTAADQKERVVPDYSTGSLFYSVPFFKLHGSMGQKDRTSVYFEFCKAKEGVLLCTDVGLWSLESFFSENVDHGYSSLHIPSIAPCSCSRTRYAGHSVDYTV